MACMDGSVKTGVNASSYDVIYEWGKGNVPHVQPVRPAAKKTLPRIEAGPGRLQTLMTMWIDLLPSNTKDALRAYLSLAQNIIIFYILYIIYYISNYTLYIIYYI